MQQNGNYHSWNPQMVIITAPIKGFLPKIKGGNCHIPISQKMVKICRRRLWIPPYYVPGEKGPSTRAGLSWGYIIHNLQVELLHHE